MAFDLKQVLSPEQYDAFQKGLDSGKITIYSPELQALIRQRFMDDPLGFVEHLAPANFQDRVSSKTTPSAKFHHEMMSLALDPHNSRIAFAAPRGHAKSTTMTFAYPLHQLLYQKKKFIIIVSATEDIAKRFLKRLRDELEFNPLLKLLFGPQKTEKWSETEFTTQNGCTVIAKGRGAQMRGLLAGSNRPDLIICDDLEDDELVLSETRRIDLEDWFNGAVLPTLDPKVGQLVFIGTILHMDSLLNRLLNTTYYPDFVTRTYAAIIDDANHVVLWPEKCDYPFLQKVKESYIARMQLAKFYMEYQNDPVPAEAAIFKPEFFQFFEELPPQHELITEVFIDLGGGSDKKTADPTAIVTLALDKHNTIYVHDYVNERFGSDTKKFFDKLFEINFKYKPRKITVEKTVATNMIKAALETEMKNRKVWLNVEYVLPTRGVGGGNRMRMSEGKYQRIAVMEAPFKFGAIKIRRWMTQLQEQLLRFPRGQHDDIIDALAYGYHFMQRRIQEDKHEPDVEYEPLYPGMGI